MKIRRAVFTDLPRLLELGKMMHEEFHFKRFTYNELQVRSLMLNILDSAMGIFLVAEDEEGIIQGGIMAEVYPLFFSKQLQATDYALFLAPEHRGNMTAPSVIKEYVEQAKILGAEYITLATTTEFETERVSKMFERVGGKRIGSIYEFSVGPRAT